MLINPYIARIQSFVETVKRETDISHMRGPHKSGETPPAATWQDKAWQHKDKNGTKVNFIFALNTTGQTRISTIDKHDLLASPWHELLKAYALHLTTKNLGAINKRKKITMAREVIVDSEFFSTFACDELVRYWKKEGGDRNVGLLNDFIKWLKDHELIPLNTQKIKHTIETKDATEELQSRRKKLPDDKVIMVMGAIQHKVIPWDTFEWKTMHPLDNQRDAFVCAMFTLSMSSPNRVEAEQTVLNLQSLKAMTETIDGKKKTVHYLNWSGSKGFDDNKNHIVAEMVPVVSLILDYISVITAANRVLARFYKKPCSSLKDILQDYKVEDTNWEAVKPDPEQPINLFSLGYLLGFYELSTKKNVLVKEGTDGAQRENRGWSFQYSKPIAQLQLSDEVIASAQQLSSLLALHNRIKNLSKELDIKGILSVGEIQRRWLGYIKKQFPLFPMVRNRTNDGCCDIEHRLFAFNSSQLNLKGMSGGNDYKGSISPFSVMSPVTMGKVFVNDLSGSGGNNCKTIFERHGFSQTFRIMPHQMRHYMTDIADKGGLPVVVNNMWGGRKDPNQIIHYVHSTDDERAESIVDILYNEDGLTIEKAKQSIRLICRDEYVDVTGEVASVTSSGICTQNLMVTPCQFLNDFNVQCVFCSKSCHVVHDDKAITLLKEDLKAQKFRLKKVSSDPKFITSDAMQSWFKLHLSNTEKLNQLIELMVDPEFEKGEIIRMLVDSNEFRISNLKKQQTKIRKLALPDTKEALNLLLQDKQQDDKDDITEKLLRLI